MKQKQVFRRLALALLSLALTVSCLPRSVLAAEPESCSLQLSYAPSERAMANVTFRAYRVADVDMENVTYHPTEVYAPYRVLNAPGTWLSRAATLSGYVARDRLPADRQGTTDADGLLRFEDLTPGLYLITGDSADRDGYRYTPTPFLISLPYTEDGEHWTYDISTHVKYTYVSIGGGGGGDPLPPVTPTPTPADGQIHVIIVWEDEGFEDVRPGQVTVDLLRDGEIYDTVTIGAGDSWRYTWINLPSGSDYQVVERTPGENYTVSSARSGLTFVITNTYTEDIDEGDTPLIDKPDLPQPGETDAPAETPVPTPGEGDEDIEILEDQDPPLADLPQTGLLWWPVPVLAFSGFILLLLGIIRRRRGAYEEEE